MKILLIGEYSNVHATLAQGLRSLGHHVVVASNGDFWKNYPRDLDWARSGTSRFAALRLMAKICSDLPRLRGFDIVQFINPVFAELKAERLRPFYRYLRRHNKRVILCAMGMDWFWVHTCTHEKPLRYSDFNIGAETRTNADAVKEQKDWLGTAKGQLNKFIARDCDGIVAGLYEYYVCYKPAFPEKTVYIPLPIHSKPEMLRQLQAHPHQGPLRLFIGINERRSEYKGTDIMLRAAEAVARQHPSEVQLRVARSVPFRQYVEMMNGSDAILDQLYSYTPSMNSLEAMSRGLVCIGGGEEEHYRLLGEAQLRPIVNVQPNYESVYSQLEKLVANRHHIDDLKRQSIEYVNQHHDHLLVAKKYEAFYERILQNEGEGRTADF